MDFAHVLDTIEKCPNCINGQLPIERLFYKEWAHRSPDITNRVIHLNRQNVKNEIMYNISNF